MKKKDIIEILKVYDKDEDVNINVLIKKINSQSEQFDFDLEFKKLASILFNNITEKLQDNPHIELSSSNHLLLDKLNIIKLVDMDNRTIYSINNKLDLAVLMLYFATDTWICFDTYEELLDEINDWHNDYKIEVINHFKVYVENMVGKA